MTRFLDDPAKGFPLWSAMLLAVLALTAWLIPERRPLTRLAVLYGGLISAATSLSGFALVVRSSEFEALQFFKRFIGGMILRLGLGLAALGAGITVLDLPVAALVISCLASYFVFTLLEYFFLLPLLSGKIRRNSHD